MIVVPADSVVVSPLGTRYGETQGLEDWMPPIPWPKHTTWSTATTST